MKFDIALFQENIKLHANPKPEENNEGRVKVIGHLSNLDEVSDIDFDSFTLNDTYFALEAVEFIGYDFHEEDEELIVIEEDNPFFLYGKVASVISSLTNSKGRVYEYDDFV